MTVVNKALLLIVLLASMAGCASVPPKLTEARQKSLKLNQGGAAAFEAGDYQGAEGFYSEALRMSRSVEDFDGTATNLFNLAAVYRRTGDRKKADGCLDEIFGAGGMGFSPAMLAEAAFLKALLCMEAGDWKAADGWADSSLFYCKDGGCKTAGGAYNIKARVALRARDYKAAISLGESALGLNKGAGDQQEEANSQRLMAQATYGLGQYGEAERLFALALALDKRLGLDRKIGADLVGEGNCLLGQGRFREAAAFYERAVSVFGNAGDDEGKSYAAKMLTKCRAKTDRDHPL